MTQTREVRGRSTTIFNDGKMQRVIYHQTAVVSWDEKQIILDTGGFQTATTKLRKNQAANQFALGYSVMQDNFEWFVTYKGEQIPFPGPNLTLKR